MTYPCLSSLLESRLALRIKHAYEEPSQGVLQTKTEYYYLGMESLYVEIEIISFIVNGSLKLTTPPRRQ